MSYLGNDVTCTKEANNRMVEYAIITTLCFTFFTLGIWYVKLFNPPKSKNDVRTNGSRNSTSSVVSNSLDDKETSTQGLIYVTPKLDDGFSYIVEKSRCMLLSICTLSIKENEESERYADRPWSLRPCGSLSYLWTCAAEPNEIILRSSMLVKRSAEDILRWLVYRKIYTGLEGIYCESSVIQSFQGESVVVRRITLRTDSLMSLKTEFIVVTSVSVMPGGVIIVASRSLDIPKLGSTYQRNNYFGYIRGIVYASGFILKPIKSKNNIACEISLAVHINLGDDYKRSHNTMNQKVADVSLSVSNCMENLYQECKHLQFGYNSSKFDINILKCKFARNEDILAAYSLAIPNLLQQTGNTNNSINITTSELTISLTPCQKEILKSAAFHALEKLRQLHVSYLQATAVSDNIVNQDTTAESPVNFQRSSSFENIGNLIRGNRGGGCCDKNKIEY